jgi:hypothetical protein
MSKYRLTIALLLAAVSTIPVVAQPPVERPADSALAPVPTDAFYFASVKVSKIWDHAAARPLRDWMLAQKGGGFDKVLGIPPAQIDRLTLFAATAEPAAGGAPVLVATTRQKLDVARLRQTLGGDARSEERRLDKRSFEAGGLFPRIVLLDDRTILYLPRDLDHESLGKAFESRFRTRKPDGPLAPALAAADRHDLVISLDLRGVETLLSEFELDGNKAIAPYLGLAKARTATLTADFDKTAKVRLTFSFPDAESAKRAELVLRNGLKALKDHLTRESHPFNRIEKASVTWLTSVLKGATVEAAGSEVIATAEAPFADDLARLVAAMPKQLASTRDERTAINNLKQLALAMHNFHDANGRLPGDVMMMGDKTTAWSWRVQILPYVEQDAIYRQFDFTKPWDDPGNLKLLEGLEMPKIFELPGREAPKGHTYYRIFSLPKNSKAMVRPLFTEGERGPSIAGIVDGTSNTFMIVEAGEAVPWFKPDVLAYDGKLPLPPIGDPDTDRLIVAFGDGSVRSYRLSKLSEKTVRALITIDGGEVVELP